MYNSFLGNPAPRICAPLGYGTMAGRLWTTLSTVPILHPAISSNLNPLRNDLLTVPGYRLFTPICSAPGPKPCATMRDMLKCHWCPCARLMYIICYLYAIYAPNQNTSRHQCLCYLISETPLKTTMHTEEQYGLAQKVHHAEVFHLSAHRMRLTTKYNGVK